ncbi:hypothetical protein BDZ85DRAFT_265273 [Elsinoe ampelina]|uniref:Uncharacterized protein n=1 Tax=Elsinoe ampelina TaxID=302913 RepID=A0A6A6G755_9PEZI|nr:hypothetical protein BDZ85DRAFT_265273 [Elsinoe ampelina]
MPREQHGSTIHLPFRPILPHGPFAPFNHGNDTIMLTRDRSRQIQSRLLSLPQEIKDIIWSYMTADNRILLRLERIEREPEPSARSSSRLAGYFDFAELETDSLIYDMWHHEDSLLNPAPSSGLLSLVLSCKQMYILPSLLLSMIPTSSHFLASYPSSLVHSSFLIPTSGHVHIQPPTKTLTLTLAQLHPPPPTPLLNPNLHPPPLPRHPLPPPLAPLLLPKPHHLPRPLPHLHRTPP